MRTATTASVGSSATASGRSAPSRWISVRAASGGMPPSRTTGVPGSGSFSCLSLISVDRARPPPDESPANVTSSGRVPRSSIHR